MLSRALKTALALLLCLFASCAEPIRDDVDLAIVGVTVIDVTGGTSHANQTVLIADGSIVAIRDAAEVSPPSNAEMIDASDKYLIPGLWDMHTHVLYPDPFDRYMLMLLANGVTSVRDMNSPMPLDEIRRVLREAESDTVLVPRIMTPLRLIDGPARSADARGPEVRVANDTIDARVIVESLAGEGADFIKVYNNLTFELVAAVIDAAHERGLNVVGHIPLAVAPRQASDLGMDNAEHLNNVMAGCATVGEELVSLTAEVVDVLGRPGATMADVPPETIDRIIRLRKELLPTFDEERCRFLAQTFARNGTWHTPTLVSNRGVDLAAVDSAIQTDERLKYVPASVAESWASGAGQHPYRLADEERLRHFGLLKRIVALLHEEGVSLLAGTDLGVGYVYAGFSLHDELELLVESGLSPIEALGTATINPARFLGRESEMGTVETGNVADLVLLDADPRQDIGNTRSIRGVVLRGQYIDRPELDALLERAGSIARGG